MPSPVDEPLMENTKEAIQKLFDSVAKMTAARVKKVHKNKKYVNASSYFSEYNVGQAFSRGANDIVMVSFLFVTLTYQNS